MSSGARLTREEYKKKLELEEARKAGTAPAELDEDGNEINPHIPQYIAQAPWYLQQDHPGLKHQRAKEKEEVQREWYKRGQFKGPAARKYRKGACENCGAMTHKKKDCVERPRKIGAKYTNKNIRPDEIVQDLNFDYDGSHDRWNGYDTRLHNLRVEKFHREEEERRKQKEKQVEEAAKKQAEEKEKGESANVDASATTTTTSNADDTKEGLLEDEGDAMTLQKRDDRTRTTVRNLRIREDTAKYLRNLDVNSAYYDPKTRSMRENPNPNVPIEDSGYGGDNFVRASGESKDFTQLESFAWEAAEKGATNVNPMSNPSQAEFMRKEFLQRVKKREESKKDSILQKYGGEEHLDSIPRELRLAQTEAYREYSADGKLLKGEEAPVAKSKYEEDVYTNGHTTVWGSYWRDGQWGYHCCHSFVRNSVCLGKAGIEAEEALLKEALARKAAAPAKRQTLQEQAQAAAKEEASQGGKNSSNKDKGKGKSKDNRSKEEKLRDALRQEEERERLAEKGMLDDRKRKYNSMANADDFEATEEQMEAYRLKKKRWEDPMNKLGGSGDDELLPLDGNGGK